MLQVTQLQSLTPAQREHPELAVSARLDGAQHRHGQLGRPEPSAALLPSDQRGLRARDLPGRVGIGRLRPHERPRHVLQPEPEHRARHRTTRATVRGRTPGPIRSASCDPASRLAKPMYTANTTVRYITTQYGYSDYDALNMSVEKRYSQQLQRPCAHIPSATRAASRPARGTRRSCRRSPTCTSTEYEALAGTDRAHNFTLSGRVEIPKDAGRDAQRHAAHDDRHAVHDSGRHAGFRSQPHQLRAAAGRHVQPGPGGRATRHDAMSRAKAAATAHVVPASCSSTCASATGRAWADAARWTSSTRRST